ncbi:MAG: DUF308 domain-containing protein [Anaerolineaceae bacterium]|nr:DUF308 domain-containing protein [Anaerolineaceae bacterium]
MTGLLQRSSDRTSNALILRGAVALLVALILLFAPGVTLVAGATSLVILFGIYALVDGVSTIYGSIRQREGHWLLMLLVGAASAIAGVAILAHPIFFGTLTLLILIHVVAIRSIIVGALELASAWRARDEMDNVWLLGLSGFASLVFGLILLTRTFETLEALLLILPFYLMVAGAMQIGLGLEARRRSKTVSQN